jgi:lipopolysaccharide export system permease protein
MKRLTVYILRQLVIGTVLVTVGLLAILWLTQSLRFIDLIVNEGASVTTFLTLTGLLLPNFLIYVLPIALFAVVLFAYNRLNSDRELVVMRAMGIGPLRMAQPALLLAVILTGVGWYMSLWAVPESVKNFREMQWTVRNDLGSLLIREGAFSSVMPGVTVYVRSRSATGVLQGLLIHDERDPARTVTVMAERGALIQGADGSPRVTMVNGNRQEVEPSTGTMSLLYFDSYTLDLGGGKKGSLDERFRDARERSLENLLTTDMESDPSLSVVDVNRFRVEAHQRLANPLSHITLTLVALAFLLSGSFDRRGAGKRLMGAVGALVLVESMMIGAGNLATSSLSLLPLLYLAVILPALLSLVVLLRPNLFTRRSRPYTPPPQAALPTPPPQAES